MSVSGISTASLLASTNQNVISKREAIQKEFQQLGQDIQSGDLGAAQADYVSLQQLVPKLNPNSQSQSSASSSTQSSDPRVQAFDQLEKDIQSGNVSAAQQDYSNIQQMFQNRGERFHHHMHNPGVQPEADSQAASSTAGVSVTA
jgi:hypothetical protein